MTLTGKCSSFGGPDDQGVSPSEGLAVLGPRDIFDPRFSHLFLPAQPPGTTGLARRLNPDAMYCAMRWNYAQHPLEFLRAHKVTVRAQGITIFVQPADWGPNADTDRIIDLSPGALRALGLATDATVTVEIPDPAV